MKHLTIELFQLIDLSKVIYIFFAIVCNYMINAVASYTLSNIYIFYLIITCLQLISKVWLAYQISYSLSCKDLSRRLSHIHCIHRGMCTICNVANSKNLTNKIYILQRTMTFVVLYTFRNGIWRSWKKGWSHNLEDWGSPYNLIDILSIFLFRTFPPLHMMTRNMESSMLATPT